MAREPSESKIFTKEFILDIVMKLLGFFFFMGVILVMLLIGLRIGEVSLNLGPLAIRFSTPEATGTQTASPSPAGSILFQDDFSSTKSGWGRSRDANAITDYDNGGYRIQINTLGDSGNGVNYWSNPGLESSLPGDVQIDVDATMTGGPDDNDFGVICRYTSTNSQDSYYHFIASSDGFAGIQRVVGADQKLISAEKLQPADAIQQGQAMNHIRADCIGDKLTLYINGKLVAAATDPTLSSGDVGLIAGTYSETGTDILFDNFLVSKP